MEIGLTAKDGAPNARLASRIAVLAYGAACYGIFFATFVYAIGFIGGFGTPTTLDGPVDGSMLLALLINLGLLGAFALQHSLMARPGFKRMWTKVVLPAVERSTYVLFSSLALIAMFVFWQPLGGVVWQLTNPVAAGFLYAGFAFGWLLVLVSTFLINHFDLFGLRQVWLYYRKRPYSELKFVTPWPYRVVRHPLYLGWLFVIWCTPSMTMAHLLFAIMTTAYIFIGIQLEERDLEDAHGDYGNYKRRVPMILPGMHSRRRGRALA